RRATRTTTRRPATPGSPPPPTSAERPPQELEQQRPLERQLFVVRRAAVATLDVLVVPHVMPLFPHARDHLAGVPRVYAVVPGRRGEQRGRPLLFLVDVVVRRERLDVRPFLRSPRVAVLGHPGRSGEQFVVPPHVQQRHLAHDRAEQFRVAGE